MSVKKSRLSKHTTDSRRSKARKKTTIELVDDGPESPLTPNLLEGNTHLDAYLGKKFMIWHKNKQRDVTTKDQQKTESALKSRRKHRMDIVKDMPQ